MEPPPPLSAPITTTAPPPSPPKTATQQNQLSYPESVDSSPHSRKTDLWEDPPYGPAAAAAATASAAKLRLMCSYGGRIVPRPHDKSLCYVGGDTRIIVVDRQTTLADLQLRLSKSLLNGKPFTLKYQLPTEDLDSLISVTTDEDLENMVEEYDRSLQSSNPSSKTSRLRLFLFSPSLDSESSTSLGSILEGSKTQDWFFSALNWNSTDFKGRTFSDSSSVNCLLGLDDSVQIAAVKASEVQLEASGSMKSGGKAGNSAEDVHSVPDSPMLETNSSFGSSSSSPSMANLPPIKVHVEEVSNNQKAMAGLGIEEQFQQMNVVGGGGIGVSNVQKQEGGGYVMARSPMVPAGAVLPVVVGGEYVNRVLLDDERSDQGLPAGLRKGQQLQQEQPHLEQHHQHLVPQLQNIKSAGGFDLTSPDSVSSDSSVANQMYRQKPIVYQEQTTQIHPGNGLNSGNLIDTRANDTNSRMQIQDPGYMVQSPFDQYQQLHQPHQFLPNGAQYIQHHPSGTMPVYYSLYPQQLGGHGHGHPPGVEQHPYPVYFMPTRQQQPQVYSMPPQQPGYTETPLAVPSTRTQTPPSLASVATYNPATAAVASATKPDLAAGVYRTSATPPIPQVPSSQSSPLYGGFSQVYHQTQPMPPSAATPNYGYEYADPSHPPQVYYTKPLAPQVTTQYQTMAPTPAAATLSDAPLLQISTENVKQPVRTQP